MLLDANCVFFQKLYVDCVFFYRLNTNCVFYPTVTGELTSARMSLLESTVAMDVLTSSQSSLLEVIVATGVFCLSLLSYHYNDVLVATGWLPMATVTYGPLLQCQFVVVIVSYPPFVED
jgi:hypothetical protein